MDELTSNQNIFDLKFRFFELVLEPRLLFLVLDNIIVKLIFRTTFQWFMVK